MTPFEKLSIDDQGLINEYIELFAAEGEYEVTSSRQPLNIVLNEWNNEKNNFLFKMFGEELILRRLFVYQKSIEGIIKNFELHRTDPPYYNFLNWWINSIKYSTNADKFNIELIGDHGLSYSKSYYIQNAFSESALATNSYQGEEFKVIFEDNSSFKVSSGMKPMKIIHKFIEKFGTPKDEQMFEEFRIWHSRLLNQKTVDGELCLSIHPLDYMTMSNNDNDWSSCMRWADKRHRTDHGDYCAGTLECMNSPFIVVAYLHNPNHPYTINDDWSWNSKQWRELFIVNEGVINEIKAYPYQDENLTNGCITWLKELAFKNLGWTYSDEEINVNNPIDIDTTEIYLDYIHSNFMYMDIGTLKKHVGRVNYDVLRDSKKMQHRDITFRDKKPTEDKQCLFVEVPYGGVATCLYCGNAYEDNGYEHMLLCPNCEYIRYCPLCGEPLTNDAVWIEELEDNICYECYEDKTATDNFTDELHLIENMENIGILIGYDANEHPVYHDNWAFIYNKEYNDGYDKIFSEPPKEDGYNIYVTIDMVNKGYEATFCDIFGLWPRDLNKFYSTCLEDYDIVYDWNHNLI